MFSKDGGRGSKFGKMAGGVIDMIRDKTKICNAELILSGVYILSSGSINALPTELNIHTSSS